MNTRTRLRQKDIDEIKRLYAEGKNIKELASMYNRDRTTILWHVGRTRRSKDYCFTGFIKCEMCEKEVKIKNRSRRFCDECLYIRGKEFNNGKRRVYKERNQTEKYERIYTLPQDHYFKVLSDKINKTYIRDEVGNLIEVREKPIKLTLEEYLSAHWGF